MSGRYYHRVVRDRGEEARAWPLETPLGTYTAVSTDKGLMQLTRSPPEKVVKRLRKDGFSVNLTIDKIIIKTREELTEYFNKARRSFSIRLDLRGTDFQLKVWDALLQIPYGEVISYRGVAEMIGRPRAYRAVGNAVGSNPIAIIIPCHRVVKNNNKIGGYSCGVEIKERLLEIEGSLHKLKRVV